MPKLNTHLLETCERLVTIEKEWAGQNLKLINKIFKKIETKKSDTMTRTEKVCLSEYFDIRFTSGKVVAYIYTLQCLNGGNIQIPVEYPNLIEWTKHNLK